MSAEHLVVVLALHEGVVADQLAVGLGSGDALPAGRVDGDGAVLGDVEVRRRFRRVVPALMGDRVTYKKRKLLLRELKI